jgi:ABC-2 type transport system permease protein/oleandomycin transport system permease protein
MLAYGSLLGFRFSNGVGGAIAMVIILLILGFAFSWVAAYLGMVTHDEETAQLAGFLFVFPLVFASAAFVPVSSMAKWLQYFANNQPVTFAVDSARQLALGLSGNGALWKMLLWVIGILLVFVPLSVIGYRKRT